VSVKTATAASLNTAYTDLWHKVAYNTTTGQHPVVNMAAAFGVDVKAAGLTGKNGMQDEAGTALGQASLTAEEQATTVATLAAGGVYSSPHVIYSITSGSQVIPARVTHREVLTPAQAADVDWAMSFDTVPGGGGTAAGLGLNDGQTVIAKTGTTNLSQSAFFMGATPKYAMAVGMFVSKPTCPPRLQAQCSNAGSLAYQPPAGIQTLFGVGDLSGYGGQYPALIWHDFFNANFDSGPLMPFPQVNNDGAKWNLMGNNPGLPKPHHHQQQGGPGGPGGCHGQGQGCHHSPPPTPPPTPTPTATATPTSTATPTGPPGGFATRAATSGGTAPGVLALAAVVVVGPSLSLIGRLRERRRRKALRRERPPAN
jgi:membrane peptidoglycan carboxypeptidase